MLWQCSAAKPWDWSHMRSAYHYLNIIVDQVQLFMATVFSNGSALFQYDNATHEVSSVQIPLDIIQSSIVLEQVWSVAAPIMTLTIVQVSTGHVLVLDTTDTFSDLGSELLWLHKEEPHANWVDAMFWFFCVCSIPFKAAPLSQKLNGAFQNATNHG